MRKRRSAQLALKIDKWVYMKALEKCVNDYHLTLLKAINLRNFTQSDRDMCHQLAFGNTNSKIFPRTEVVLPVGFEKHIKQLFEKKEQQFDKFRSL